MRFMLMVIPKAYEHAEADFTPPVDLVEKMTKFNQSLGEAGVLLGLDGLAPPKTGARVRFAGGKPTVIDGPFIESKELVGAAVFLASHAASSFITGADIRVDGGYLSQTI